MKELAHFLFECSPFEPFWSAWFVGFCVVGMDGQVYLTSFGEDYLRGKDQ